MDTWRVINACIVISSMAQGLTDATCHPQRKCDVTVVARHFRLHTSAQR